MNKVLQRDLKRFLSKYQKFQQVSNLKGYENYIVLNGKLDVIDTYGNYWDSYQIAILLGRNSYPFSIPIVFELSNKISRENYDFHISKDGECCLDIPHKLQYQKRKGIYIDLFYKEKIYPFFANHQYRLAEGNYANGEYKHYDKGIVQFYKEEFNLEGEKVIKYIELALSKKEIRRNGTCPICASVKYKNCCSNIVNKLKMYGQKRLNEDLMIFNPKSIESF